MSTARNQSASFRHQQFQPHRHARADRNRGFPAKAEKRPSGSTRHTHKYPRGSWTSSARQRDDKALFTLAEKHGIQTSYEDMGGARQTASTLVLREILRLWGIEAERPSQARESLRQHEMQTWQEVLPPVQVCWDHHGCVVEVRLRADLEQTAVACRLLLEDGACRSVNWNPHRLRSRAAARIDNRSYVSLQLPLPPLPFGYHRLELRLRDRIHQCFIISAPSLSYSPPDRSKNWGLFLPLYALRSEQNWGAGNFSDWARLAAFTAAQGGSVLATLPLLAAFLDSAHCEPSPYCPVSRLFWNEFFLDVEKIPEFNASLAAQRLVGSGRFREQLEQFRAAASVDYKAQMGIRREVLELMSAHFFKQAGTSRQREFQEFLLRRPDTLDYSEFRATCEHTKVPPAKWEERMRNGKLQPGDYAQNAKNYHLYVQWAAEQQVAATARNARAKGFRFYLDLPVGVHAHGYDMWRYRDVFASGVSVGAPPDLYFPKGQNWGFAPLLPERIRRREYRYVIDMLRFQMRHAAMLRIDHVLGLHRLYWISPGGLARDGVYVRYPAEEFYAILALESHRNRTILVGENLGTVPAEVNDSLARHRLHETYALQYEQQPDPKRALRQPSANSVASVNTHDMPPFCAHWGGEDIQKRVKLGLLPEKQAESAVASRRHANEALVRFLRQQKVLEGENTEPMAILHACLKWLGSSKAETVLVNLEDLWGEQNWQNVPGTTTEHPNWCRKARLHLEEIARTESVQTVLQCLAQLRPPRRGKRRSAIARSRFASLAKPRS